MKNIFLFIIVSLSMSVLLLACSPTAAIDSGQAVGTEKEEKIDQRGDIKKLDTEQIESLPAELKRIHEKGKLEVAVYSEDRFPYFFLDNNGELTGSDIEMAYDIAHHLGIDEVEFNRSATSYEGLIHMVAKNEVDLAISKVSVTLNRAQSILFSEPYVNLKQAVLLNRLQYSSIKNNDLDIMETLRTSEVKIGVISGTSYVEFAVNLFSRAEVIQFDNKDKLIEAVLNGEIVAAFYDEYEFKEFIKDEPDALIQLQLSVIEESKDEISIALPPDNYHFQAWLNHYFDAQVPVDMEQVLEHYRSTDN